MANKNGSLKIAAAASQASKARNYWLNKFSREIITSSFPYDFNKTERNKSSIFSEKFSLNEELFSKLMKLCNASDPKLHMILMAALLVLLKKYTNNKDIIVGVPIYKQKRDGKFTNTVLALRNNVEDHITFKELLLQVRQTIIEANEHQGYPMERLSEKLNMPSLFATALLLENIHKKSYIQNVNLDLLFSFFRQDKNIEGAVEYNTLLYEKRTINRIISNFTHLLRVVLPRIDLPVDQVNILSDEEKKEILYKFNETAVEYQGDQSVIELFEEQADGVPDHIAVEFKDKNLTYKELNKAANQLAYFLRRKGVQQDTIVGIMTERSIEMVLCIIGILKAGGCYLPVDSNYPERRILSILNDSGVPLLLTNENIVGHLDFTDLQNLKPGEGRVFMSPPRLPIKDPDRLPIPDRTLINYEKYHKNIGNAPAKHTISILGSRGCPYNCMFCHKIWPKQHVVRSAENIFEEISYSYDAGIKRFVFLDDIFNLERENSSRLLEKIIKHRMEIQLFFPNGLRADILTRDYIDLLVEAGTVNFDVALETVSSRIQKMIRKNLNIEKFRQNVEYIIYTYPHVILEMELMFGFPTETEEEALLTFNFLRSLKWVHFPNLNILKIYPNTDMSKIAVENGISQELIERSSNLAYHELPETLPFPKSFARQLQAQFTNEYFLNKERLLHILPGQMKILTEDELVKKYNSYLPMQIECFPDLLECVGITNRDLGDAACLGDDSFVVPDYGEKVKKYFPSQRKADNAFRILLLDLTQLFTQDAKGMLYDVVEAPLGLMYLLTYLNREFGSKIIGKISKSRIDFDSFDQLKILIDDFQPKVIGIRALSFYRDLFHKTVSLIKHWYPDMPIISGGPYSTCDYSRILSDRNIDVVVVGEGEQTFSELMEKIMENGGKLPGDEALKQVAGIAFIPGPQASPGKREYMEREVLLLDHITGEISQQKSTNPEKITNTQNLSYVLYTSGSTGKPKGVAMGHGAVANLILWQLRDKRPGKGAATLQFAPSSFDVSFQEIFSTLCSGGRLILISEEMRRDMAALISLIKEKNLERLFLPFVALQHLSLAAEGSEQLLLSLRDIITAGEQLQITPAIAGLFGKLEGCRLHNHYGPTETHVVTAFTLKASPDKWTTFPSIGKPISNSQIYLLDLSLKVNPIGIPGELYISGAALARGYLNRPELTFKRFIDNPYRAGSLLYRTGDLARWAYDGNIEFLGRMDNQVKIRGFRIELGEIESRLLEMEEVKEAVVIAKKNKMGETFLAAYIVRSNPEKGISGLEPREFLSKFLPDYMVPSYFIQLAKIPLTASGKTDRRALPEPEYQADEKYTAPTNAVEEKLGELWSQVLGLDKDKIGIDDNFYNLGGHSLKATILTSKIHKAFNVKVTLGEIFNQPTIRELARGIKELAENKYTCIEPVEEKEYYPLSSAQKRLYIHQQAEADNVSYNMPMVIVLEGDLDVLKLETVFQELICRHENLRTSLEMLEEEPVQRIHDTVEFEIEYDDIKETEVKVDDYEGTRGLAPLPIEPAARTIKNFIRPFDLSEVPFLRVGLIKLPHTPIALRGHPSQEEKEDKYLLMVDIHHIISDGTSLGIFIKEFMALYTGEKLQPLRIHYKDFSQWQNRLAQTEEIKKQESYWLKHFEGEIPVLNLPTDYPAPIERKFEGNKHFFEIDPPLTAEIKQLVSETGTTLFIVLLAGYTILLSKYTGQQDVVVGTGIAGRKHDDLENIIGLFINILAMRNHPQKDKTFMEFLKEVRENTLDAYANQDYPYEELVNKLGVQGDTSGNPLFETILQMQNIELPQIEIPGLTLKPDHYETGTCRFDLVIYCSEFENILRMTVLYSTELFQLSTVRKLGERFIEILSQVVKSRENKLEDITISQEFIKVKPDMLREEQGDFEF